MAEAVSHLSALLNRERKKPAAVGVTLKLHPEQLQKIDAIAKANSLFRQDVLMAMIMDGLEAYERMVKNG